MKAAGGPALGESRTCPHCKQKILKSAAACPVCQHFLRFEAVRGDRKPRPSAQPLRLEWTVGDPFATRSCEYSVMLALHDEERGEISRQVVTVGALAPSQVRTFKIWVEIFLPEDTEEKSRAKESPLTLTPPTSAKP